MASTQSNPNPSPKLRKTKRAAVAFLLTLELLLSTFQTLSKRAGKRLQGIRKRLASRPRRKRLGKLYVIPKPEIERVQTAVAADITHQPDRLIQLLSEARKGGRQ